MTQTAPFVRSDRNHGFVTLTLDSPHNRNAISTRLVTELRAGLEDAAADPEVRAVFLTHIGGTFCAGADLSEAANTDPAQAADGRTRTMIELMRTIVEMPTPVVAVVDGHVRAGGMGLIAACDIVVAGPSSTFALTEARLALAPFMISLTLLPRISSRAASRYFLTGSTFDAAEAQRIGLVTVATSDTSATTVELKDELRRSSPQGLAESKRLVNRAVLAEFDAHAEELAQRSASFFGSDEVREGIMSFLEKRPPRWAERTQ